MSKQAHSIFVLSIAAAVSLSAHRFITGAGGYGADAIGVTRADAAPGDLVATDIIGTAVVETGGAVAALGYVQADATGRAVAATGTAIQQAVIAGGAAGELAVTGIKATDRIVSVVQLNRDASAANITLADLTAEFSIADDDAIDNTGGTATTGDALLVTWETPAPIRALALQAASGEGQFIECLLLRG